MLKRILLFLLTNLLVMVTIGIVILIISHFVGGHLQGQEAHYSTYSPYGYGSIGLPHSKSGYISLLVFCFIWGTAGAFISLMLSRWTAKRFMGVQVINLANCTETEGQLVRMIYRLAERTGLSTMPEVGIYDSMEVNAFATGPSRRRALVAVSSGLIQQMSWEEMEGVLGHEVSHIANGDMVTMTLIQGVVNAFAMFLARVLASIVSTALSGRRDEEGGGSFWVYFLLTTVFQIVLTLLGSLIVAAFSRWREYRADAGGARLSGKSKMIAALQKLKNISEVSEVVDQRAATLANLKISKQGGWLWWSSHPPLENRIKRLQEG
jgi:heat shock protein HtpX